MKYFINEEEMANYSLNAGFAKLMYILQNRHDSIEVKIGNQVIELNAREATALEQYIIDNNGPLYKHYLKIVKETFKLSEEN